MELTDEQIFEFQTLFKRRFGVHLDKREALKQGLELLNIMSVIHKPITKRQLLNHKPVCVERERTHERLKSNPNS
jgi:hypothetical protein